MRWRRLAWVVAVSLAGLSGCIADPDLPPLRYETEHLLIGTSFDAEVCAGSLSELEKHISFVEAQLDIPLETKVEFYWFEPNAEVVCEASPNCAMIDPRRIYSSWSAARHELVHAVIFELGDLDDFIAEGLSEAFDGNKTEFGFQSPYLSMGYSSKDTDYSSAGHFARWLREVHGSAPLRGFLRKSEPEAGPEHARSAFLKAYGFTLEDAEDEYFAEAPERYGIMTFCDYPALDWEDGLDTELELDCDSERTWGAETMVSAWTFEVSTPGWYVVEVDDGVEALVRVCQSLDIPLGTEFPPPPVWPIGEDAGGISPGAAFGLNRPATVYLGAQTHRLDVSVLAESDGVVGLRIHPKVGAAPP